MSENAGETDLVVRSLNRLTSSGYDDRWIAEYLSEKTGRKVQQGDVKKNDFTLKTGGEIGWRSWRWITLKPEVGEE